MAVAVLCAATAHAANYKMLLCAGNNGSNSFDTATNPGGQFAFENHCGPAPDPAGNNAFLRIYENSTGTAGVNAYGSISWTVPPWIEIRAGGGYTREPNSFNDGWRGRFWAEDWGGGTNNILMQGTGAENSGINWSPTSTFAPHLWPFSGYGNYRRFVFELTCFRPAGCDRSNFNAVDANSIALVLDDVSPSQVGLTGTDGPFLSGQWVRGTQSVAYNWSEQGSGIRMERVRIDGADRWSIDHQASGECDTGWSQANGEFARTFEPCPNGAGIGRSYALDTASLSDGPHVVQACAQDYAQWKGLDGTGGESCDQRTVHTDNTAPGKPAGLEVTSANPLRYLDHFGARWSLPPDPGSPVAKVHYNIVDATGKVVVPERAVSATNPTALADIEGPKAPGAYILRVWLEDSVGLAGPAAETPIPHDTTPPAAPQDLRVAGQTSHWADKLDLRWRDVIDTGSPIDLAHYQLLDGSGEVVGATHTIASDAVQAIDGLQTPAQRGSYTVRVWLSDEEGNIGSAASVPVPRDTTPPAAPQDLSVTSPGTSRAADGFDVRWRNVGDDGAPIDAVHYQLLNEVGGVAVPTQTIKGDNVEAIQNLLTPQQGGDYTLRLWLEDAEGNVGVPSTVPLAYECISSNVSGGTGLTAGLGDAGRAEEVVRQGTGSTLRGKLSGARGLADAPVCVFSRVVTDHRREFLGVALTAAGGGYQFAIPAGPSREVTALYRSGSREVSSHATVQTIVHPTFDVYRKVVYNKHSAQFTGTIPGPDNNEVVVVLQVKRGNGWLAFHRYRTREGGRFTVAYRFTRTDVPTKYPMRAQVRAQAGYPYLQGNSDPLTLIVLPRAPRRGCNRLERHGQRAVPVGGGRPRPKARRCS